MLDLGHQNSANKEETNKSVHKKFNDKQTEQEFASKTDNVIGHDQTGNDNDKDNDTTLMHTHGTSQAGYDEVFTPSGGLHAYDIIYHTDNGDREFYGKNTNKFTQSHDATSNTSNTGGQRNGENSNGNSNVMEKQRETITIVGSVEGMVQDADQAKESTPEELISVKNDLTTDDGESAL